MAIRSCVPRGKERSRWISALQEPFGETAPPVMVNVLLWPSMLNVSAGERVLPSRSVIPLPLLDVSMPLTVKNSPAAGLSVIGSRVRLVGDLMVMVTMMVAVECRVLEPLNMSVMAIRPRGWECGTSKLKLITPAPLVCTGVSQVSWNLAVTVASSICLSLSLDSTRRAPKLIEEPLSTTVLMTGVLSMNWVTPRTRIEALPVPVR